MRCVVFVDCQSANAFHRLAGRGGAQVKAVVNHVAFHAQIIGQAHLPCFADLLEHHMQHQR